jgi:hypothetical protein
MAEPIDGWLRDVTDALASHWAAQSGPSHR